MSIAGKTTSDGRDEKTPQTPRRGVLGWIVRHPKLTALGVLLLMAIGSCELLDMRAERAFQQELDAIRASGAPVTLDDLNAIECDVPDDENISLLIAVPGEVLAGYRPAEGDILILPFMGLSDTPACGQRLPPNQRAAAEACIAAIGQPLVDVHEALQHDQGCLKVQWTSPAIDCSLSTSYGGCRSTAKAFRLAGWMAAEAGDREIAYRSVCEQVSLDRALHGDGGFLRLLVRLSIRGMAMEAAVDTVNLCGLDDSQLAGIQSAILPSDWIKEGKRAIEVERALMLDTVQWLFTAKASTSKMPAPPAYLRFIPIVRPAGNAKALQMWQRLVDAFDKPEAMILIHVQLTEMGMRGLPGYCLAWRHSATAHSRGVSLVVRTIASQRAMIAALACERYRLAKGDWPESLDALVPTYLDAVPLDPFDAKPIRYTQFEHGVIIYSVGEDQRDGSGDVTHRDINNPKRRATDDGFVLLNPELRNREPVSVDDAKDEAVDGKQ